MVSGRKEKVLGKQKEAEVQGTGGLPPWPCTEDHLLCLGFGYDPGPARASLLYSVELLTELRAISLSEDASTTLLGHIEVTVQEGGKK